MQNGWRRGWDSNRSTARKMLANIAGATFRATATVQGPLTTHRRAYVLCCCCRKVIAESLEPADTNEPVVRTSIGPCGPCLHDRIRRN
jgi:hypothetical protein